MVIFQLEEGFSKSERKAVEAFLKALTGMYQCKLLK
jgi:hypothetical protein